MTQVLLLFIEQHITRIAAEFEIKKFCYAGALIIEPVIQGAGGMLMVDPLFQRLLVGEWKRRKIPVIFDEVLTGY
uniref:Bifunctional dethiobiotin synthetase/7,8-diamino-pelargonic acid aminotransferase, mitochondrial n=1 Tax=Tanacetum cinerariifolium TaxID=118510 RepID=A0A6L2MGB2_TANCI|nr:bifunctional dethiobiotin synthetase/7,8-diamino-pelargonic acid aminotransferase, mitochondrial [Tanacetum cinerariifolium]